MTKQILYLSWCGYFSCFVLRYEYERVGYQGNGVLSCSNNHCITVCGYIVVLLYSVYNTPFPIIKEQNPIKSIIQEMILSKETQ